jgi:glycogen phosphorylase
MLAPPSPLVPRPLGLDRASLREAVLAKLVYAVGKDPARATRHDWFRALALAVRDRLVDGWMATTRQIYERDRKRVYYLSLEFLIGRLLADALHNLGLMETAKGALADLGVDAERVFKVEPDAALGNGGLGRLAACLMDSMATLGVAGFGYGIRYQHGLFKQGLDDGWQVERPEDWLAFGNPWEFERPEAVYPVRFYGHVREEATTTAAAARPPGGRRAAQVWDGGQRVLAVAYDTPVVGWGGRRVNTLRLWSAQSGNLIDLEAFDRGDYVRAVHDQVLSESISRVLYPNDATEAGQELRLKQEYFFTAASLQDILRRHLSHHDDLRSLPDRAAIQLNDTHPAIAVPELMRLLVDEHGMAWEEAWEVTRGTVHYTNHTLMPEALERWPVALMERLLPRHLGLIYEINEHVLASLRARPQPQPRLPAATLAPPPPAGAAEAAEDDGEPADPFLADVSMIDEGHGRFVRMGHLAFLGARRVNGVSALHGALMGRTVFRPLHRHFPDRIASITNGVTPRRWLLGCNPGLAALATEALGGSEAWVADLERLEGLAPLAADAGFRARFAAVKRANKERLAAFAHRRHGLELDPEALFDVQIKRIHEYKRQLLNALEAVACYADLLDGEPEALAAPPRVKILAGKAAPSYWRAKLIIKLINDVARACAREPRVRERLQVVFLPNYNVSLAELVIPAADLSEQISTAGMEASGTGNMKLALNGALTIGTLDGANIEIRDRVGPENVVIFGLTAEEVAERRAAGNLAAAARAAVEEAPALGAALAAVRAGAFSPDEPDRYAWLVDGLLHHDHFMVTADFASYAAAQRDADALYRDGARWRRVALRNTAGVGWFSSDRTIREYAAEIWDAPMRVG